MTKEKDTAHFTARDVKQTVIDDFNTLKSRKKKTSPEMFEILVNNVVKPTPAKGKEKELQEQNDQLQKRIDQLDAERSILFRDRDHLVEILNKYLDPHDGTKTTIDVVQDIVNQYESFKKKVEEIDEATKDFELLEQQLADAFDDLIKEYKEKFPERKDIYPDLGGIKYIADAYNKLKDDYSKTQTQLTGAVTLKDDHQFICSLNKVIAHNARACRPFMVQDGLIKTTDPKEFPNEFANLAMHNFLVTYYNDYIPNA